MPAESGKDSGRLATFKKVQPVLEYAVAHLEDDLALAELAQHGQLSAFHLHRVFAAVCGETPKQLLLRLRIERAAVLLLTSRATILEVALTCGFQSHEVFLRAFRRQMGTTPSAYRRRGFAQSVVPEQTTAHVEAVCRTGPCVRLYHIDRSRRTEIMYAIETREIDPQPVLVMRRRVKHSEIGTALGEMLPHVFIHAQQHGIALAGQPFTRYLEWGPGVVTMEAGMQIADGGEPSSGDSAAPSTGPGEPAIAADALPGGLVATTLHTGVYERLTEAHAALEQWIESEGLIAAGPPWEVYVTDPADFPDTNDWKTELFWPVQRPQ